MTQSPLEAANVDEALNLLSAEGRIGPTRRWTGVPEHELRRFEETIGRQLPVGYRRFLAKVGIRGATALADGSALLWPDPLDFPELIGEMGDVPFSDQCTPILIHQGYYVQWIDGESGAVLGWTESEPPGDPVPIAPSFSSWLLRHSEA